MAINYLARGFSILVMFMGLTFGVIIGSCATTRVDSKLIVAPGEKIYRAKCTSCHRLLPVAEYSNEQWNHYVEKYGKQMTPEQKGKLLQYLQNNN